MRNPERIDLVLKELEIYWKNHPDMRLAQIVLNFAMQILPQKNEVFGDGISLRRRSFVKRFRKIK